MSDQDDLRAIATSVRLALEEADKTNLPIGFALFPRGSCGDAALVLGAHLKDVTGSCGLYVLGRRGEWSHGWIERDGLIIDITADQFPEVEEPVIVEVASPWHETFRQESPHEADYRIFDSYTVSELGRVHRAVLRILEKDQGREPIP